MEAFSLIRYWRGGGHGAARRRTGSSTSTESTTVATTTIVTTHQTAETDDDNDEGPFFDLEFSADDDGAEDEVGKNGKRQGKEIQNNESEEELDDTDADDDSSDAEIEELDFALCSSPAEETTDPNAGQCPSDDLFFKGRLVPIEPDSSLEPKSPQFSVSLQKSATKFRVLLLKLKKSKLVTGDETGETKKKPEEDDGQGKNKRSKFFTVKFKVEEVPIVSFFTRENNGKSQKRLSGDESVSDEKKFSKELMQKYLKKVRPLYVKVSRKYGEKLGFSGQLSADEAPPSTGAKKKQSPETSEKQGNNTVGGVRKHLGKSRSGSVAVGATASTVPSWRRRDDSLLQVEDGIQSAILHCKRSFNGGSTSRGKA